MSSSARTSHKPRKRRGITYNGSVVEANGQRKPAFPLAAFLWPAKGLSLWFVLPSVLLTVALFRWATGLWTYSGYQAPPMHGDFEAQRHWMELTIHLPISQWYFYDLQWWGLDYPPLTAYHSWLLGKVGSLIEPSWFALDASRGLDDSLLKVYMRGTVLLSEYFIYIPAVVVFLRRISRLESVSSWESSIALVAILMQPSTLLIDHGHFQYNTVMLGFSLASLSSMIAGRLRWACVFFVAALGFKQMALFYAPAIFAYLLGSCISPKINLSRFISIALVTVLSFGLLFAPLLLGAIYDARRGITIKGATNPPLLSVLPPLNPKAWYFAPIFQLTQSIHRIFPFARGLFEDKVANVWCALHTFHKLHIYPQVLVQRAALAATTTAILPPLLILLHRPRKDLLPLATATTAWGFFLCAYQVHEKNILLPLLPMTMLLGGKGGLAAPVRTWVGFANVLGAWTLFPLLRRDGLAVPYAVLLPLWAWLLGLPPFSLSAYRKSERGHIGLLTKVVHLDVYSVMVAWHVLEALVPPPEGKPDLWVVVNVLVGAGGFGLCYLWCLGRLLVQGGYVAGVEEKRKEE
ncbi:dolichyl pyrophosphate Man9GlcNAc2 alpha-1,3-glucosyltransferas-like protein [Trichodelitschia bisporula]|uniref:Alpha-1,3-glucosyltransferase n=1 Tax=Trichodelitschia bisporula TaxID=703511 RepID=A0A6G1HWW5_9PEZI|nr:dolichyl pyrophosphate Man9GlcNAc2 alpha-1,3-glucosyltransferas-like protein [Trichodelitschia bisporula]